MTSAIAVQVLLAALYSRTRTGKGQRIDLNMLDAVSYFNFPDLFEERTFLEHTGPVRPRENLSLFPTADGWIVLGSVTRVQVESACRAAGHPEWIAKLSELHESRAIALFLSEQLEKLTVTAPSAHWLAAFRAHDVPVAPVLDIDAHLADDQVRHNDIYGVVDHPRFGPHRYARYPAFRMDEGTTPFPDLDEHGADLRAAANSGSRRVSSAVAPEDRVI